VTGARLVAVPEDRRFDRIEPGQLGGMNAILPLLMGNPGVVDRPADEPDPLAVNHEAAPVVGD
jgi:hypothetical protein